jgi:hypothetical protein
MVDLEEALKNIEVFCRVLVDKILEENEIEDGVVVEPIENLLRRKYIIEESLESNPIIKSMIPLPQLEEPLIDIFEDDNYVRILVQCRCQEQKVSIHTDVDGVEICKKECYNNADGAKVCVDKCQKLSLPVKHLQMENMITKCNNEVLEVNIPKQKLN